MPRAKCGKSTDQTVDFYLTECNEDLVLMGDVGTGKTHMAEALCTLCCQQARPARFFAASSLVMHIRRARDDGRLDRGLSGMRTKSWTEEVRDWGSACTAGRTSSWPWRGSPRA